MPEDHVGVMADDLASAGVGAVVAGAGDGLEPEVAGPCGAVRIGAAVAVCSGAAGRGIPGVDSAWGEGAGDEARGMAGQQWDGIALVDVEGGAVQGGGNNADEAAGLGVGIELLQGGPA